MKPITPIMLHIKFTGLLLLLMAFFIASPCHAEDGSKKKPETPTVPKITAEHYRIFDGNGKPVTIHQLLQKMNEVEVIFLGELHDDPVAHHVQKMLFEQHHQQGKRKIALSLEMFERDVQHIVDEYLADLITEKHFLDSSRPWSNYKRDYRPLVEFAKKNRLPVIAANAPRRYVSLVGRLGAKSLTKIVDPEARGLPPLPYGNASQKYAQRFKEVMKNHSKPKKTTKPKSEKKKAPKFDINKALQAQSLWDATMAYSITQHLIRFPNTKIVHLNGRFHTKSRLGICEHLQRYRPGTTFLVLSMYSDKSFPKFHCETMLHQGDFVIVTDPNIRKSVKKAR